MQRVIVVLLGVLACGVATQSAAQAPAASGSQQTFESPKAAADKLLQACKDNDEEALGRIFGPVFRELTKNVDEAEERARRRRFWEQSQEVLKLEEHGADRVVLVVGKELWPMPIPLVKGPHGWSFNTSEGIEELKARRIGENELAAIDVCREYAAAQREYASYDHDGDGVLEYAQRIRSTGGTQGAKVPGGKYDYVINGNMIAGFALVAWPVEYRSSGVMTFVVSHHGKVYEKDLGPQTQQAAAAMEAFEPDESWSVVP